MRGLSGALCLIVALAGVGCKKRERWEPPAPRAEESSKGDDGDERTYTVYLTVKPFGSVDSTVSWWVGGKNEVTRHTPLPRVWTEIVYDVPHGAFATLVATHQPGGKMSCAIEYQGNGTPAPYMVLDLSIVNNTDRDCKVTGSIGAGTEARR